MKPKTVKMSTRKGNAVLLEDVLDRALGESLLLSLNKMDVDNRYHFLRMLGKITRLIADSRKKGENSFIYHIDEDWE